MWFLRRMLRIPWTDRKRNEEVLEMAEYRRDLMNRIEKRKARFFWTHNEKRWYGESSYNGNV